MEVAAALVNQVKEVGASFSLITLESCCARPCKALPPALFTFLRRSQVSIFAAAALPGELPMRMQLTRFVNEHGLRHAHMVNITPQIMKEGMQADFFEVDALSTRLIERARRATYLRATSSGGSELSVSFSPSLKWVKTSGMITPEKWGNLPGGEIFTSPERVDGLFVVDGVVGDFLCSKYGDLKNTPLFIEIEDSRIRKVDCHDKLLLKDFLEYIRSDENSDRAGEFAIGTNLAVTRIIGNILQDEKIPGVHIAFGNPYPEHTGANWRSSTHIDCVGRDFDIWFEEEQIMRSGRFLI